MTERKKLDIEPLGDARWSRIERDLFDRVEAGEAAPEVSALRESPAPRWPMASALVLAGALAAIGGAAGWHTWGSSSPVAPASSQLATGTSGSNVHVGEATLDIAPESAVTVAGDDEHGIVVRLDRGRVECEVPPRKGRPPFEVEAGDVTVKVVGTHFAVTRSIADVDVHVDRGVVQVTRGADHVDLHPGESWSAATGSGNANGVTSSAPMPSAPPARISPTSTASPSTTPSSSPHDVYDSASRLEVTDPDAAIVLYRGLASRGGPWGMNALYAEGRLEADRGRKGDARRALESYLAKYPNGPNAEDSRQLLQTLR